MKKITRTHDDLYLHEDRYNHPKRLFQVMTKIAKDDLQSENEKGIKILDVGCAAGEFPYFLKSEFPEADISAFDLRVDLIEKAKIKVAGVNFYVGDILDSNAAGGGKDF